MATPLEALKKVIGPAPKNMGVSLNNAVTKGAIALLSNKFKIQTKAPQSYMFTWDSAIDMDLCAVMGISNDWFVGSLVLCIPKAPFLCIASALSGQSLTEITDSTAPLTGQILNGIHAEAKMILSHEGLALLKSMPMVFRGNEIQLGNLTKGVLTTVVPIDYTDWTFNLLINYKKQVPATS